MTVERNNILFTLKTQGICLIEDISSKTLIPYDKVAEIIMDLWAEDLVYIVEDEEDIEANEKFDQLFAITNKGINALFA